MLLLFTFLLGVVVGVAGCILARRWPLEKGPKGVRPFFRYLIAGTVAFIIFIFMYNALYYQDSTIKPSRLPSERAYSPPERFTVNRPSDRDFPAARDSNQNLTDGKKKASAPPGETVTPSEASEKKMLKKVKEKPGPIGIKKIGFSRTPEGAEAVLIYADGFFEPIIFPLAGDRPRIVIDIRNTRSVGKGVSNLRVGGTLIRGVRTHLNQDSQVLRVVLDLAPSKNYYTDQLFYKKDNIYSLEVREDTTKD